MTKRTLERLNEEHKFLYDQITLFKMIFLEKKEGFSNEYIIGYLRALQQAGIISEEERKDILDYITL